jgi:hypothetical protein
VRELGVELTWLALKAPITLRCSQERGEGFGGFFPGRTAAVDSHTLDHRDCTILCSDTIRVPRRS